MNQLSLGITPGRRGGRPRKGAVRALSRHAGLYRIRNTISGSFYVGSATWFARRLRQHRSLLEQGKHPNAWLQSSFNKHGAEAFVFEILVVLEPAEVLVAEQRLLDKVFGTLGCMNIAKHAEKTRLGMKQPRSAVEKTSAANRGRKHSAETRTRRSASHALTGPLKGKYKGVMFEKSRGRWRAQIKMEGTIRFLGRFDTAEEAALAYNAAALEKWGADCFLNEVLA